MSKNQFSSDTSEKLISLPIKTFVALAVAIVSIAITVGGYKRVLDDFEKIQNKIDRIQDDIRKIEIQNAEIKTTLDINLNVRNKKESK